MQQIQHRPCHSHIPDAMLNIVLHALQLLLLCHQLLSMLSCKLRQAPASSIHGPAMAYYVTQ